MSASHFLYINHVSAKKLAMRCPPLQFIFPGIGTICIIEHIALFILWDYFTAISHLNKSPPINNYKVGLSTVGPGPLVGGGGGGEKREKEEKKEREEGRLNPTMCNLPYINPTSGGGWVGKYGQGENILLIWTDAQSALDDDWWMGRG